MYFQVSKTNQRRRQLSYIHAVVFNQNETITKYHQASKIIIKTQLFKKIISNTVLKQTKFSYL